MAKVKNSTGIVFSTDPNFSYYVEEEVETLPKEQQLLKLSKETAHRKGKVVTIVRGFIGKDEDLKDLAKQIKTKLGVGGTTKDGEIVLQGEWIKDIKEYLQNQGYKIKGG